MGTFGAVLMELKKRNSETQNLLIVCSNQTTELTASTAPDDPFKRGHYPYHNRAPFPNMLLKLCGKNYFVSKTDFTGFEAEIIFSRKNKFHNREWGAIPIRNVSSFDGSSGAVDDIKRGL